MTLDDLKSIELFQTRSIAEDAQDEQTHAYIVSCLQRFYAGDYGTMNEEDTAANNADLAAGRGHILARYKRAHKLRGDIYINCYFSEAEPGIDYNNLMIMYCNEY